MRNGATVAANYATNRPVSECDMQHGSVLREVDLVAFKHGVAELFHFPRLRQIEEHLHHSRVDAILGVIQKQRTVRGIQSQAGEGGRKWVNE